MMEHRPDVHIVDDDELVRESLSRLLRSEGFAVRTFSSATAFLNQRSKAGEPSCVVLDVMMPGMTGLELQEELRRLHSRVPIIFVSGQSSRPMMMQAFKGGAVAFLEKPFDPDRLFGVVARVIDQRPRP
jgi:FixJ family two-component response regulator